MASDVEPFNRGGLRTRTVALLVCIVMVSSAIPMFALMTAGGTHSATVIAPIQDDANDYVRYIQVNNFRFDPLVESPDVPEWLSYGSLESSVETYCIVQFNGPVTQQMKEDLGSTGMQVLYYINYNAFIVMTNGKALDHAKALPSFRWAGVFEPAYKLSPRLSDSYEQMLSQAVERNRDGVPGTVYSPSSGGSIDSLSKSYDASSSGSRTDYKSSAERTTSPYQASSLPTKTDSSPTIDVLITTFDKSWVDEIARTVSDLGGSEVIYSYNSWGMVRAVIDKNVLIQLAREPGVMWIDRQTDAYFFNDIARWVIQSADTVNFATPIHEQGIWGTGQTVTVGDTGIDYDHNAFRDPYNVTPGPNHRKVTDYYIPPGAWGDSTDNDINHGSHVSGTVAGDDGTWHVYDGNPSGSNGTAGPHDGQAFDAKLQVQDLSQDGYGVGTPADLHDLFQPALNRGSYIHTNSWGSYGNQYITEAAQTDDFLWDNQDFIVCFAAGNSGSSLSSISPFAAAKNVIGVGATENGMNMEDVAGFSSRGPCVDGRLKPDVMAPGSGTWSVRGTDPSSTQNDYWQLSGTSMATPTVAGSVALIRQYYMDGFFPTGTKQPINGFVPSAALVKATLINGAAEMTGDGAYANGELKYPNNNQGWGRVLLDDALFFKNDLRGVVVDDKRAGLATGGSESYDMAVGDSSMPVEITLVWTDFPGVPMSSPALVNDLNLVVTAPGGTVYRGNVYQGYDPGESAPNPALSAADHLNNVESVLIVTNPRAGLWTVTVSGFNVPMGPQPYAIVMSGGLATDKGTVGMDESVYKSSATVNVRAVDLGLNLNPLSIDTVTVNMSSTTETVPEVLLLTETGVDTAVFAGSIQLQNYATPTHGDGLLQVQNRDNVTAEYFDEDDGLGGSGPTYDFAVVDDDPPVISDVDAINIRFNRATVVWTTDEVSSSVVKYGDSIPPSSSLSNPQVTTSHQLMIRSLQESTTYYFSVESTDEAGNHAIDDNGSAYYEFTTTAMPPAPAASNEWPTFQNNMARVGASPRAFSPPIERQWNSAENYYSLFSSPIMADGMLFSTSLDGYIRARDAFTGDLLWQKRLGDRDMYTGTPTVVDGIVYTTFYEEPTNVSGGTVYALDELTGDVIWSVGPETGIDFNARIAMADADGMVFGAAWSGEIFAMNASTGAIEWTYDAGDIPFGGIVVDLGQVFIGTVYNPRIISLDETTGSLLWERAVDADVTSAPMVSAGSLYVGTYGGTLYCLDEWSGSVVWQVGGFGGFFYSTPTFDGSSLYFSTTSGNCYAVDAFDGSRLWSVSIGYAGYGSIAFANGFLYVAAAYEGELLVLDAIDGSLVDSEPLGSYEITSSPSVSEGWVWIEDYFGSIHAFMGQIPVGLLVSPHSQTKDVVPSSVVDYTVDVTNTGSSGPDTFDAIVTLGAMGWATELFKADGVTPLPDTDSDSIPDTGPISKGNTARVVVRVTVPGNANAGDRESTIVNFRSSNDLAIGRDASIISMVPPPGVDIGPRSYFLVSPGDVRTAWMNITNTGAFSDTIDITAMSLNGWNFSILSQDGVTPLPDTDTDGLPDTGSIPAFDFVTISVRVEVPSAALPETLDRVTVTGRSSLDVNATGSNNVVLELPTTPISDWPTFHNGNKRQGASPSLTTPPLNQEWVAGPYFGNELSGPVFADGILFSTTVDGFIRANNPYTGTLLWSRSIGDDYYYQGTPAVEDGIVYNTFYGLNGGFVYALDELTGDTVWSFGSERGMDLNARTPMAVSGGLVFGSARGGEVFAVDAYTGAEVWRYQTLSFLPSGVAISGGAVYFGTYDGSVFALDESTGQLLWSCSLDGAAISTPMCAEGMLYIGTDGGSMYALGCISGDVVWQRSVGTVWLSTPAYGGSAIYFGVADNYYDGYFYALDAGTGSTVWSAFVPSYIQSSVAYANGYVFGTAATGILYTLSASSGSIVDSEYLNGYGSTSSPAVSEGWVWVQDGDGYLYGFRGLLPVGVEVEPALQETSAVPNSTLAFTVTVKNIGTSGNDTFDVTLSLGPNGWPAALFSSDGTTPLPDTDSDSVPDTGTLATGASATIVVKIDVPGTAAMGDTEETTLTFTSSNDPTISKDASVICEVPPPGAEIGPNAYIAVTQGTTVLANMTVTNTGAFEDTIDLVAGSAHGWIVSIFQADGATPLVDTDGDSLLDTGLLGGGMSLPISIAIEVPADVLNGTLDRTDILAASSADPSAIDEAVLMCEISPESALDWPQFQHDAARTGISPIDVVLPFVEKWYAQPFDSYPSWFCPVIHAGTVFYSSEAGYMVALDLLTGEVKWETMLGMGGYTPSGPTVAYGNVYVAFANNWSGVPTLYCLDEDTGIVIWSADGYNAAGYLWSSVVAAQGMVFWHDVWGYTLYANDAFTGEVLWTYVMDGDPCEGPAYWGGMVFLADIMGKVVAIDAFTGVEVWSTYVNSTVYAPLSISHGVLYFGDSSGNVYSLDAMTGEVIWTASLGWMIDFASPVVADGMVYIGVSNGTMYALDESNGSIVWSADTNGGPIYSSAAYSNGIVFCAADNGHLYAWDALTGALLQDQVVAEGHMMSSAALANAYIVVCDESGGVTAYGFEGVGEVDHISVSPASTDIGVLRTAVFEAHAYDLYGNEVPDAELTWSSLNELGSVVYISDDGTRAIYCAGPEAGYGTVRVTSMDIFADAGVNILAGPVEGVFVSPASASVVVGGAVQFSAEVEDMYGNTVPGAEINWSVQGGIGTISDTGIFTAGLVAGTGTVEASSSGIFGVAAVTVLPGELDHIIITPDEFSLAVGGITVLRAQGYDSDGNAVPGLLFVWTASIGSVAPIPASGEYAAFSAGTLAGSGQVQVASGGVLATVPAEVLPAAVSKIVLSPGSASVVVGGTQSFTATALDMYGNEVTGAALAWSASSAIGTISQAGLLTASTVAGSGTVSASVGSVSASAVVTILPGTSTMRVVPGGLTVEAGSMGSLEAITADSYGNVVEGLTYTWTCTIGSVFVSADSSHAVFIAGNEARSGTVTVTNGSHSMTVSATVTAGPLATLVVDPAALVADSGDSVDLTVTGYDAYGNVVANLVFTWAISSTSSTNDSIGTLTAHADTKTVTLVAGNGATGTITVTCGGKSAVVSVTVNESSSALTKAAPTIALAAIIAVVALAVLLVLMWLGKLRTAGKKE